MGFNSGFKGLIALDLHALEENIREEIAKLSAETLPAVMRRFLTRVH